MTVVSNKQIHSPIRIGVVGVGFLGERHARIYSRMKNIELLGVMDIDLRRAKKIARICKTRPYEHLDDLLADVDAVSVVTPTGSHLSVGSSAIEAQCHVLIEKPITTNVSEADHLLDLAKKHRVILQVGHVERFNAAVTAVEKILKNPRFIEVHRLGSYSFRSTDIDVVLDLMIHDIDIVLCLVKSKIKEISAYGTPVLSQKNDIANAKLIFENKCIVNLTASRLTLQSMRKIRVFDEEKYVSIDYMKQEAVTYSKKYPQKTNPRTILDLIHRKKLNIRKNEPLQDELNSFVCSIQDGVEPLVSGLAGREALAIAEEIICQVKKY